MSLYLRLIVTVWEIPGLILPTGIPRQTQRNRIPDLRTQRSQTPWSGSGKFAPPENHTFSWFTTFSLDAFPRLRSTLLRTLWSDSYYMVIFRRASGEIRTVQGGQGDRSERRWLRRRNAYIVQSGLPIRRLDR